MFLYINNLQVENGPPSQKRRYGEGLWGDTAVGKVWGGNLFTDGTAKFSKQQKAKSEILEVGYDGGHDWLKGAHVLKWGGIPGSESIV